MNLLVFSDSHSSFDALNWLEELLKQTKIDAVVSPGDLVNSHDKSAKSYVQAVIDTCYKYNKPFYVVFGNNEPEEVISQYERLGVSLHNKSSEIGGVTLVGIGDIESYPERIVDPQELPIAGNVLITHRPPVKNPKSEVQNSKFVNAPAVHICGHLHSQGFVKKLNGTLVVNTPAALKGGAAIVSIPSTTVQFIKRQQ